MRTPFEIASPVICLILVDVIDFGIIIWIRAKCFRNQSMNAVWFSISSFNCFFAIQPNTNISMS